MQNFPKQEQVCGIIIYRMTDVPQINKVWVRDSNGDWYDHPVAGRDEAYDQAIAALNKWYHEGS